MGNAPGHGCEPHDIDEWGTTVAYRAGEVLMAATPIFQFAGVAAYHTSVVLGDMEFYFNQQGITASPALWSHLIGQEERPLGLQTEVLGLGDSPVSGLALMRGLQPFFADGSYDLLRKNCNTFTDAALYFLTRTRLDSRFSRLERMILAASPVSTGMLNGLLWARVLRGGEDEKASELAMNPLAQDFSVEDVVAQCDALDAEAVWQSEVALCDGNCAVGKSCLPAICASSQLHTDSDTLASIPGSMPSPKGRHTAAGAAGKSDHLLFAAAVPAPSSPKMAAGARHMSAEGGVIPSHRANIIRL